MLACPACRIRQGIERKRRVSREGCRLPDAVIRVSAGKADREAIPEGMDDEGRGGDNPASGRLGAANGEHTSLAGH